jgi:PD-(D/E)XK nuclease superfamily
MYYKKGTKMQIDEMLVKALTSYDKSRERSQQKQIGVSQLGGCRKQVWLQLQDTPKENQTLKLPALMGTAIHKMIEEALVQENAENWTDYQLEQEVEHDGIKGHIDLYIPSIGAVVDWKTTKLKNLTYFPSKQQRWQVQVYAWLLAQTGQEPKTVTLVGIPRDGDERNIRIHTEEYNSEIALEAIAWLRDVEQRTESPDPERYAAQFCKFYCSYFGTACGGMGKEVTETTITDNQTIGAIEKYLVLSEDIKEMEAERDGIKTYLEGINGVTPNGNKVQWTQVAGRQSIDEEAVKEALGSVPKKQGEPTMRLMVK